eukprot:8824015-Ditylum_brightwellii.AAC.1
MIATGHSEYSPSAARFLLLFPAEYKAVKKRPTFEDPPTYYPFSQLVSLGNNGTAHKESNYLRIWGIAWYPYICTSTTSQKSRRNGRNRSSRKSEKTDKFNL